MMNATLGRVALFSYCVNPQIGTQTEFRYRHLRRANLWGFAFAGRV